MINFKVGEDTVPIILPIDASDLSEEQLSQDSLGEVFLELGSILDRDTIQDVLPVRIDPTEYFGNLDLDALNYGGHNIEDDIVETSTGTEDTDYGPADYIYQEIYPEDDEMHITLTRYPEEYTKETGVALELDIHKYEGQEAGDGITLKAVYGENGTISHVDAEYRGDRLVHDDDLHIELSYDQDGNLESSIEETIEAYFPDSEGSYDFKSFVSEKEYDSDGNIISQTDTAYDHNEDIISRTEYGPDGQIMSKVEYDYEDDDSIHATTYDEDGNVTFEDVYDKDWEPVSEKEYNEDGSMVERTFDEYGDIESEVEYDSDGNEVDYDSWDDDSWDSVD